MTWYNNVTSTPDKHDMVQQRYNITIRMLAKHDMAQQRYKYAR